MPTKLQAILWDNHLRLEGTMILARDKLIFQYKNSRKSDLSLAIAKERISSVEEYLLFGIERKGILIKSNGKRTDRFIVEDPGKVKKTLRDWIAS